VPGVNHAGRSSNVSVGDGVEQSSTMPRRPPHVTRLQRRASDVSTATAQQDDPSEISHKETPVKTATDRLKSDYSGDGRAGEALKTPSKTFSSPVAMSPANTGFLAPTNTRRIGSKFCIDLVKGLLTCYR